MRNSDTSKLKIFGYSDDNLAFEGSIDDEIGCYDQTPVVRLEDGTEIKFTFNGKWNAEIIKQERFECHITKIDDEETDDIVEIKYPVEGVLITMTNKYGNDNIEILGRVVLTEQQQYIYDRILGYLRKCELEGYSENMLKYMIKGRF